jgi:ABC-type uncharacterized transport system permease subunit
MNSTFVGILSVLSYSSASVLIIKELLNHCEKHRKSIQLAWLGALLHCAYLVLSTHQFDGFNFSFFNAAGLVALFIVLILLIGSTD